MSLGPSEIIIVALVALVVLGPDKLPAAARTIGKYLAEFRKFSAAVQAQVDDALKLPESPADHDQQPTTLKENPDTSGFQLIDEKKPPEGNA